MHFEGACTLFILSLSNSAENVNQQTLKSDAFHINVSAFIISIFVFCILHFLFFYFMKITKSRFFSLVLLEWSLI